MVFFVGNALPVSRSLLVSCACAHRRRRNTFSQKMQKWESLVICGGNEWVSENKQTETIGVWCVGKTDGDYGLPRRRQQNTINNWRQTNDTFLALAQRPKRKKSCIGESDGPVKQMRVIRFNQIHIIILWA